MNGLEGAIQVVVIAHALADAVDHARLGAYPSHIVIGEGSRTCLISQRREMAVAIGTNIVAVGDNWRRERTCLRTITFAGNAMERVIAIADGLGGCAGLVG